MNSRDVTIISICLVIQSCSRVIPFADTIIPYFVALLLFSFCNYVGLKIVIIFSPYFLKVTQIAFSGLFETIHLQHPFMFVPNPYFWWLMYIYLLSMFPLQIFFAKYTVKKLRLKERIGF